LLSNILEYSCLWLNDAISYLIYLRYLFKKIFALSATKARQTFHKPLKTLFLRILNFTLRFAKLLLQRHQFIAWFSQWWHAWSTLYVLNEILNSFIFKIFSVWLKFWRRWEFIFDTKCWKIIYHRSIWAIFSYKPYSFSYRLKTIIKNSTVTIQLYLCFLLPTAN